MIDILRTAQEAGGRGGAQADRRRTAGRCRCAPAAPIDVAAAAERARAAAATSAPPASPTTAIRCCAIDALRAVLDR